MDTTPIVTRDRVIRERRAAGETLQEIADDYGITRERVRQIADPDGTLSKRRAESLAERALRARQAAVSAAETAVDRNDTDAYEKCRAVPLRDRTVKIRGYLARTYSRRAATRNANGVQRFTDEQILDSIRATHAAACPSGEPLSHLAYDAQRPKGTPSHSTAVLRFGTWSEACARAGVTTPRARRGEYRRKWTEDDLIDWLVKFLDAHPEGGGYHVAEAWLRDTPGAPSAALMRLRLRRSWVDIVDLAEKRRAAR